MEIYKIYMRQNGDGWGAYVAAYSMIGALREFCIHFSIPIDAMGDDDFIEEIPKQSWDHIIIQDKKNNDIKKTAAELIKGKIDSFVICVFM